MVKKRQVVMRFLARKQVLMRSLVVEFLKAKLGTSVSCGQSDEEDCKRCM